MESTLGKTVVKFLKDNPEQRFTAREIASWIFETYPDECREKQNRSAAIINPLNTDSALIQQFVAEIGSQRLSMQKKNPQIKVTESRPRKYYFTRDTDSAEVTKAEQVSFNLAAPSGCDAPVNESTLYPILAEFLWSESGIYSKCINEKRSKNDRGTKGNKWLHPDLVGMKDLSEGWCDGIKNCVKEYADKKTKLWSFEVKKMINRSNVRETFFQAVSNSSWANWGYLVAGEIRDALEELRMLSSLHGIGFIHLNADDPSDSQIMIPAKERENIDWDAADRLAEQNKDFLDYINLVRQFYQTGDVKASDWMLFDEQEKIPKKKQSILKKASVNIV